MSSDSDHGPEHPADHVPSRAPATVDTSLRRAEQRLRQAGVDSPRLDATALLIEVLGASRAALLARRDEPVPAAAARRFAELVRRRAAREPLQYLLGTAHFLDFEVRVGPGVFIPRPETEQLVELALAAWDPAFPLAMDLCCGSGIIAVALARARPAARVLAIDRSAAACAATRDNARRLGVGDRVLVVRADLLSALAPAPIPELGVLVCNPPYAAAGEVEQPEVLHHEPMEAIVSGRTGDEIYTRVIPAASALLEPGRSLLFELGQGRESAVRRLLDAAGSWSQVDVVPDFQDIPRVLRATRAPTGA